MAKRYVDGNSISFTEEWSMKHSDHGIVRDDKGQEQPADKNRARAAQQTDSNKSVSREATRDPKLTDREKARNVPSSAAIVASRLDN
jgi:hypothetical protein